MSGDISPKRALFKGAAWTIALRWSIRAIGFVNTVVMARLLMPSDYGIVAMAFLVIGTIQAFAENGPAAALLRKDEVSKDEIDSAWTLRLIQCLIAAVALLAVAPLAAVYFKEPNVTKVIWALTLGTVLIGVGNIGTTLAHKEFNFAIDFKLGIVSKLLGVLTSIAAGYFLRDYRALVIGVLVGFVSGAVLSYAFHPYRPSWNTRKIREIWAVSKWLTLSGVGGYVLGKADEMVAARVGTTTEYGLYSVGADLGQMPTAEIGPAMLKALLPVLAALRGSAAEINASVLKTVAVLSAITLPVGLGFAALSATATQLILGAAWFGAIPFVAAYAVASTLSGLLRPYDSLLLMRGFTKVHSHVVFLELAAFVVLAFALVPSAYLLGLAWARILAIAVRQLAIAIAARKYCGVSLRATAKVVWRPVVGAALMYLLVRWVVSHIESLFGQLAVGTLTGAVFYVAFMWMSWIATGRPHGLESTVVEHAPASLKRRL